MLVSSERVILHLTIFLVLDSSIPRPDAKDEVPFFQRQLCGLHFSKPIGNLLHVLYHGKPQSKS
jgi:hypothetical protein